MSVAKRDRRPVGVLLVGSMAAALVLTVTGTAAAAGTVLFDQTFNNNTAAGTGAVVLPATASGAANAACLTATGNTSTGVLKSCPTSTVSAPTVNDTPGSGVLSLTPAQAGKVGGVFAATSVPTSQGLDVTFNLNQYGAGGGADGIAFALSAVDPANPKSPANTGPNGGSLGYSANTVGSNKGLANAYLGVGFDVHGNFSNTQYQGSGCAPSTLVKTAGLVAGQVLVRGPGNLTAGYCPLAGTGTTASTANQTVVPLHAADRATSTVPVEILINPNPTTLTTGVFTVAARSFLVAFTPIGGAQRTLTGSLPVMASRAASR